MPELPELEVYAERIPKLATGHVTAAQLKHFFTVRTFDPPFASLAGQRITGARRHGKRLVISFERIHMTVHLMLAGRLHWRPPGAKLHGRFGCWKLEFAPGGIHMTEASTRKMAAVHLTTAEPEPESALDPLGAGWTIEALGSRLRAEPRQLKSALTDGSVAAGIGNAYSDEILFDACLSPLQRTDKMTDEQVARLHASASKVLREWIERVRAGCDALPDDQPRWRQGMSVHGKFGKPCPRCATRIERISYAERETNYCPGCQTGGKPLADRRYSRFLK
jgi:formamidopyrimidine-DNA glycosylase